MKILVFAFLPEREAQTSSSLKYHRLHPEYIATRIEKLGISYKLRILLILCDIVRFLCSSLSTRSDMDWQSEHREAIRELTKASRILCP